MEEAKKKDMMEVWTCWKGKPFQLLRNQLTTEEGDLKTKLEENESFSDQVDILMQYLEAVMQTSNKNAILLQKVLDKQKTLAEEKVLAKYFAKMNKVIDLKPGGIQRSSQKLDQMNTNLLNKKSTFEDLEGLEFVLETNSELWKEIAGKIEEADRMKGKIRELETQNAK